MAFSFKKILEGLSGTSKMGYGASMYDPKEGKKWRDRQEAHYQDFGKRQKRYEGQADKFLDMYGEGRGKARGMYDRAASEYQKSEGDISRSRRHQRSADAMMGDRAFYADLARDRERIKKGYSDARLEQESLRGGVRTAGMDGSSQMLMRDAFKEMMDSEEESLNQQTAALAKTNPVAAAKLKLDFQSKMQKGYGKALQEGYGKDVQLDMNKIMAEAGLVMKGAGMLEGEAAQNAQAFNERQAQIGNYGALSANALQTAGVQQNLGTGLTNVAGGLSNMAGRDLTAGLRYEGMGYDALKDQASTANMSVSQQQQLQMSDANARAQVDMFNQNRASRGLSNALALANTAVGIGGAISSANLAGAQADYLRGGIGLADTALGTQQTRGRGPQASPIQMARDSNRSYTPPPRYAPGMQAGPRRGAGGSPSIIGSGSRPGYGNMGNTFHQTSLGNLNNQLSGNVGRNRHVSDINAMRGPTYSGSGWSPQSSSWGGTNTSISQPPLSRYNNPNLGYNDEDMGYNYHPNQFTIYGGGIGT